MPRGLSSAKLEEQDTSNAVPEQYGDNLNLPGGGANNPFLQETYTADGRRIEGNQGQNQQYYGSGYSQAQSGYSSSGLGLQ